MKLTEEQIWKCNDAGDGSYHICVAHQNVVEFARAIEREIGFDNADRWLKRMEAAIKDEREQCAKVCEEQRSIEWVKATMPAVIRYEPANLMADKCAAAIRARGAP
jgi:hypothetical protein